MRGGVIAASVTTVVALSIAPAAATHGTDDPSWIAQAGNGNGSSAPVIADFNVRTVLFSATRFGPGTMRYIAWGTRAGALHVSRSENGLTWTTPQAVLLRNSTGQSLPVLLGDAGAYADVVYSAAGVRPFELFYFTAAGDPAAISSIRRAFSVDGTLFEQDAPIAQSPDAPLITGACCAAWNSATLGPSDVIYRPDGNASNACAAVTPWSCRYVMAYAANDGDKEYVGLAGSGDGSTWFGRSTPALSPGASGSWDDNAATGAHIRLVGTTYVMHYVGGRAPDDACAAGEAQCTDIGVATSTNGTTWAKSSNNPVTPRTLLEQFSPDDPSALWNAQVVDDQASSGAGHARVYFTRVTNAGAKDVFIGYTNPAPTGSTPATAPPVVRISVPTGGYRTTASTTVDFFAADALGSTVEKTTVPASSVVVTVDGSPTTAAFTQQDTLVTAFKTPARRVTTTLQLTDGPHVIGVSVKDGDGNTGTATGAVFVDTIKPSSTITQPPPSPLVRVPAGGIGTYVGDSIETSGGSGLASVRAIVTNPLGQQKTYNVPATQIERVSATRWTWRWVSPTLDPHIALPGTYTVTIYGTDVAGNVEPASSTNTTTVLVI